MTGIAVLTRSNVRTEKGTVELILIVNQVSSVGGPPVGTSSTILLLILNQTAVDVLESVDRHPAVLRTDPVT